MKLVNLYLTNISESFHLNSEDRKSTDWGKIELVGMNGKMLFQSCSHCKMAVKTLRSTSATLIEMHCLIRMVTALLTLQREAQLVCYEHYILKNIPVMKT